MAKSNIFRYCITFIGGLCAGIVAVILGRKGGFTWPGQGSIDTDYTNLRSELDGSRDRNNELTGIVDAERGSLESERGILESDGEHLARASEIVKQTRRTVGDIIREQQKKEDS